MKFQAKVAGKKQDWVQFEPSQSQEWSFEKRPGGFIIATHKNGKRIRFHYAKKKNQFWAKVEGRDFFGEKIPLTRAGAKDADSDFSAQFPGKVRKLAVAEGTPVEAGVVLLMMEAMKMEFAIKASHAGIVKRFLVKEGDGVNPGQILLEFENAKLDSEKVKP